MVLLFGILVGLPVVNVSGLFLYRLSLCDLLYLSFLFLLFSLSVILYCVNFEINNYMAKLFLHSRKLLMLRMKFTSLQSESDGFS